MENFYYLGIDFGTSGARAIAIDSAQNIIQTVSEKNIQQTPESWRQVLFTLLADLDLTVRENLRAIAINGTSGTVLLCDELGQPITETLLYNDDCGRVTLPEMDQFVPQNHLVRSATSSLAKLLWWQAEGVTKKATYFLHQADWLGFLLHGKLGFSDYHNALKLGFDVTTLQYPDWLQNHDLFSLLPQVKTPGETVGEILPAIAVPLNINPRCQIRAGTTDSIAAFIASGASQIGEAVTSLGSTLVLKLLSQTPVNDLTAGVYSHRFGNLWLTGGASNTGGAVLKHFFDDATLAALSANIDPTQPSGLDYYPLLQPGDRFPINDPHLAPRLSPRPATDQAFLHGLLEGIARIEKMGYAKLQNLGADPLQRIFTAGGGAKNPQWLQLREKLLACSVIISAQPEAAYGSARLAQQGSLDDWEML
ncbi:MAG: FGGY-family carbohydrate kinase [Limnothrix sp. RL_2_0]|nr:FGGY-family carbohydrate kinase [Limnothrix sp. RL_2_0]